MAKLLINNNVVYFEKSDKYKTISINMLSFNPFVKEHASERTVLAEILSKSNKFYPKVQDFSIYCQELYDLAFSVKNGRLGRTTTFSYTVNIINPLYIGSDNSLIKEAVKLLNDSIMHPDITKEKVELEKRILKYDLENVYNKKVQYAYQQFIKTMFKGELISHKVNGEISDVENVTLESVVETYNEVLNYPRVFYVTGDISEDDLIVAFNELNLPNVSNDLSKIELIDTETKEIKEVKEIVESQNISQSILCVGYRVNIRVGDPIYSAYTIFNGMLGEFAHSSLFQEVREKHSLAYSIFSDINPWKGNVAIVAGIDKDAYSKTVELIKKVIEDYKTGKIDDDILELTKKARINSVIQAEDSIQNGTNQIYDDILKRKSLNLEEKIDLINSITKEQIVEVANLLVLDTIYLLKGDVNEED